ncbi:DUF4249 domain-containing protein [Panacibacter ginsenosidivorans]|uniref:DUF4249 domain-containing protein n=1 Tax=Panacibacter ginsenosidivorans TaxID=1813871 RepID=A0A5B8V5L9_9BACT|nr:DUF4249 domain-containing protein [Panacibacter ginsenosidivorans]QEC66113.1 DUF4249 domain-containing protein [Panacibacter ginsenosidivorans]
MKTTIATYKKLKMVGFKKPLIFFVAIVITVSCKEVYQPNIVSPTTGYLVVEGFINSGGGPTTITLTGTTELVDSVSIAYEHNAQVNIESDNNESFSLEEGFNGIYTSDSLNLNPLSKYRIKINTQNGKEYVSDFVSVKHTPVIDSISWQREYGGVNIYVNTHGDQNNTKYYRWSYSETWEFHAAYISYLDYLRDPFTHNVTSLIGRSIESTNSLYYCWKTQNSSHIILGTSEKLNTDRIYLPIRYIEPNAEELSVRYYIKLNQYTLSHDAYNFYQKLKKNTEQLGSIFDAQPSELSGNIHCVSNPEEQAIGFIEVSELQQKDIFISNQQVTPWGTPPDCNRIIIYNDPDSIRPYQDSYIPLHGVLFRGLAIVKFDAAPPSCVDCTLRGTNIKPSFWP